MIYQVTGRTQTVSEIPHVIIKGALDRLCGLPATGEPVDTSQREMRWQTGPNLVRGDFQQGRDGPVGWNPLSPGIQHLAESSDRGARNRFVRFELSKQIAASTGVLYYSDFFPVEEGATYRLECRWRNRRSTAKIFVKCYAEVATRYGRQERQTRGRGYAGDPSSQRREVYRSQQNLKPSRKSVPDRYRNGAATDTATSRDDGWYRHTEDFTPRHTQFTPRWGRVMLYAYWPAGSVDWDDIVVKQIAPPPRTAPKTRRPSLETKVRSEELERAR
jgi:hypothetical protein